MKKKVKALINFTDLEENTKRKINDEWECSEERANFLAEHDAVEILKILSTEPEMPEIPVEEKPKKKSTYKRKTSKK